MNGVFEKRGRQWVRYSLEGKIRREPVTWAKLREAGIEVDPKTELEHPGKILAGKLYAHYVTQRNRGERAAAIVTRRKVYFRELVDLQAARVKSSNVGWEIDVLRLEKLRAQFGDMQADEIATSMFESWFATQGWAPSTFNRYKDAVRSCYSRGVEDKIASAVPAIKHRRVGNNARVRYLNQFQPLPTEDPDLRFCTTEQCRLETVLLRDFYLFFDFYVVAVETGPRTSEQLNMTWDRVDFGRSQIMIHESKTGIGRMVPLNKKALAAFQRLYARPVRGEYCFLGMNGERVHSVKYWFTKAIERAGLKDFTPYSCRHTFGARMAERDVSMLKLSKIMGNSATICERFYAHLGPSSLHESVGRLDEDAATASGTKVSTTEEKKDAAVQ
jgi:integrase